MVRAAGGLVSRALIVAHPDDEVLWFGGLLLRHPGDWTVICCTVPRKDPERADYFHDAVAALGASGWVLPHVEPDPSRSELPWLRSELGDLSEFDTVVTHNAVGEYGHRHHVAVNDYVLSVRPDAITGGYGVGRLRYAVKLTDAEWAAKEEALRSYRHVLPWRGVARPKWEALLLNYGRRYDLRVETYTAPPDTP